MVCLVHVRVVKKKATIILEVVSDHNLWIWHVFFGMPDFCNDINVLESSPLSEDIFSGRFPPALEYRVNETVRNKGYYLADGIYSSWARF